MENTHQNSIPELPDEIWSHIASHSSSTDTLATLRATTKNLNVETYAPYFNPKHLTSGYLIQSLVHNNYEIEYVTAEDDVVSKKVQPVSLDFLPLKVKLNACSDEMELFYCESQKEQSRRNGPDVKNHYVCKGATREWMQIANPKTKGEVQSISGIVVMRANPLRYKIVRLHRAKLNTQTGFNFNRYVCQVFDSDKPSKWRKLENDIQLADGEMIIPDSSIATTVNMNLHFLVGPNRILVFDSVTEEWDFFATPEPSEDDDLRRKLSKYQGKLSLMVENQTEKTLTLWIMEDYKNKTWTKKFQLCTESIYKIHYTGHLDRFCNSETGLFIGYHTIMKYNFRTGSYNKIALDNWPQLTFGFQSDLEKMGWKAAADPKAYIKRQDAKERSRLNANLEASRRRQRRKQCVMMICFSLAALFWLWVACGSR